MSGKFILGQKKKESTVSYTFAPLNKIPLYRDCMQCIVKEYVYSKFQTAISKMDRAYFLFKNANKYTTF